LEEITGRKGLLTTVPREVKLLIFSQVINNFGFGYLLIYITVYLLELKVGAEVVGTIVGIQGAVLVLAGIPLGLLSDRKGRKWFLIAGNFLLAPTILIFAFTTNLGLYLVGAVLGGFAEAAALSSWNAMIADQTDLSSREASFSLSFIVSNVFTSLGLGLPLLFPTLGTAVGLDSLALHRDFLLIFGGANLLTPMVMLALLRNYKERTVAKERASGRGSLGLLLKFSGMNSLIGLGAGLIIPLVGTWLNLKFGVPDTYSGPFLAVSGVTVAFAALVSSRLSSRFGPMKSIVMTQGSSTVFMFSLAFIPNVFLAGGIYIVRAAMMNMAAPLLASFLMGITSPETRGLASSLNAIIWRLPNTLSSIVGGFILASGRYDLPWMLATLLYLVGISLFYINFRDVKPTV